MVSSRLIRDAHPVKESCAANSLFARSMRDRFHTKAVSSAATAISHRNLLAYQPTVKRSVALRFTTASPRTSNASAVSHIPISEPLRAQKAVTATVATQTTTSTMSSAMA